MSVTLPAAVPPTASAVAVGGETAPPTRMDPPTNESRSIAAGYDGVTNTGVVSTPLARKLNLSVGTAALAAVSSKPEQTAPRNDCGWAAPPPESGMPFWIV